ncbi:SDR family oxidoreductase [Gephyromycinifex aptenodytis]|uniref:SDR family oxidoreductase n=1 Tax=Gephyromycinifex aptenodytis TaxID=2716227 RepID=UPI001B2FF1BF|nr:SDR family oxidoreductase [Gephyromycinifex aptenodytis]
MTGGNQGIGKSVARTLAEAGSDIVIIDLAESTQTAAQIAEDFGVRAAAYVCDVTQPEQVAEVMNAAAQKMGTLDHLFNNAGIVLHKPALELSPQEWLKVINVNLNGVFFVAQAFARYLVATGKPGNIVNTASMSGTIVNIPQAQASYNASKAAVVHLTKSLGVEWAQHGIRVNSISPGYIATELIGDVREDWKRQWIEAIPFQRMGTPEELGGAVLYLLSDAATYTSGCDLIIDGLFTTV